jgi:hypothetical protein
MTQRAKPIFYLLQQKKVLSNMFFWGNLCPFCLAEEVDAVEKKGF